MSRFTIEVKNTIGDVSSIAIRHGDTVFTRLIRHGSETPDDYLRAPAEELALWLIDNWWRLASECKHKPAVSDEWRLAHDVSSVGGGYAWPRLRIWSNGQRIRLQSKSYPPSAAGPAIFLTEESKWIDPSDFESALDDFFKATRDTLQADSARAAFDGELEVLSEERSNPEFAAWRKLEAGLGFERGCAPDALMEDLEKLASDYGESSISEAAQACPGVESANVLHREIQVARDLGWDCDLSDAVALAAMGPTHKPGVAPWRLAEEIGHFVRKRITPRHDPITSHRLAELVGIKPVALTGEGPVPSLEYALRVTKPVGKGDHFAFRKRWPTGRRFELCRAMGDAIWSRSDRLGPIADSKTARQKFQRAFAQAFLCPFDALMSFIGTTKPTRDEVEAAARHFDVSSWVVRTVLVNKKVADPSELEDLGGFA
jgi:hypothetical protein